jgi:hypothetical protein
MVCWESYIARNFYMEYGHAAYVREKLKLAVQDIQVLEPRVMTWVVITALCNVRALDTSNHEQVNHPCLFYFLYSNLLSETFTMLCRVSTRRSWWQCGLRRSSAATWLLGSRVWIPPRAWMLMLCLLGVGRWRPLWWTDQSFRGVVPCVCI